MSNPSSRRLGRHVRRHGIAYAALAVAVSFSPLPSTAADLVGTADIETGAVTAPKLAADSVGGAKVANEALTGADLKNGTVGNAELAETAKGAKVYRYDLGAHDFAAGGLIVQLPGVWTASTVALSTWSATMAHSGGTNHVIPGRAYTDRDYSLYVTDTGSVIIFPDMLGDMSLDAYTSVALYRTVVTSVVPPS